MPTNHPAGHPAGTDLCGWYVTASRAHGWRCNAPALHDHEHQLLVRGEPAARSAGFYLPPAAPTSPPLHRRR